MLLRNESAIRPLPEAFQGHGEAENQPRERTSLNLPYLLLVPRVSAFPQFGAPGSSENICLSCHFCTIVFLFLKWVYESPGLTLSWGFISFLRGCPVHMK